MTPSLIEVLLAVALGAAVGAAVRGALTLRWGGPGVLAANTAASAVAGGTIAAVTDALPVDRPEAAVLLAALAGLTLALGTFSTVAVDAAEAHARGGLRAAAGVWARQLAWGVPTAAAGFALVALAL